MLGCALALMAPGSQCLPSWPVLIRLTPIGKEVPRYYRNQDIPQAVRHPIQVAVPVALDVGKAIWQCLRRELTIFTFRNLAGENQRHAGRFLVELFEKLETVYANTASQGSSIHILCGGYYVAIKIK